MSDLSTWLSKEQAAQRMGISERTLDRLGAKGPERQMRPRPGRKPEPVFNPEDVEKLASKAFVVPPALVPGEDIARRETPPVLQMLLSVIQNLAPNAVRESTPPAKLFVTVDEAATYSGLSKTCLRRLVREGKLAAIKDGGLKISRFHLDNLGQILPIATPWRNWRNPQTKGESDAQEAAR